MSLETKKLTVLFPLFKEKSETFVLLGKNAEGKKMPGIRNWFGGKCEIINWNMESTLDCVIRETREESWDAIILHKQKDIITALGDVIMDNKIITFFATYLEEKITLPDSDEMVDIQRFNIKNTNEFLFEMLSGDEKVIDEVQKFIDEGRQYSPFIINKTGDKLLEKQIQDIYKNDSE